MAEPNQKKRPGEDRVLYDHRFNLVINLNRTSGNHLRLAHSEILDAPDDHDSIQSSDPRRLPQERRLLLANLDHRQTNVPGRDREWNRGRAAARAQVDDDAIVRSEFLSSDQGLDDQPIDRGRRCRRNVQ